MKVELTTAAFISNGKKLLLIKRTEEPWTGLWHFLGGHVDKGETPQDSVIREIKEESGLDVAIVGKEKRKGKPKKLKNPIAMFFYPVMDHYHLSFLLKCKAKNKKIKQNKEHEHEGVVKWVNPRKVKVSPYVRTFYKKVSSKEPIT